MILMLGTNDLKTYYHASAEQIASGAGTLVETAQAFLTEKCGRAPAVVLVSPIALGRQVESGPFGWEFDREAVEKSRRFAPLYRETARRCSCLFLDAAEIASASETDSVHLGPEGHRKIAEALGAKGLAAFPEGAQFDRVVEAAGNPAAMESALSAVRAGGTLLPVSVFEAESCPIDMNLIVGGQITVKGCNCYTRKHLEQAAELLSSGAIRVDPVITDEMDLTEGREAFAKLCGKEKKAAKILFRME